MEPEGLPLKVAGALSGVVRVPSLDTSLLSLRSELARLLNLSESSGVKILVSGKILKDDGKSLAECGVTGQSRLLVTKGASQAADMTQEEQRMKHLDKLKAVAESMASRDGSGLTDDYEFSLENQDGTRLNLNPSDRKALVMGLALHDKGKATLAKGDHKAALEELLLAEEAFCLVNPELLTHVDNMAMLLLDIVWCCFKLQDVGRLGVCSERLQKARRMLQRAHGPNKERLRVLHGNFCPELAVYVRLELLEAVVAFQMGERILARQHLEAAKQLWDTLQVSDDSLLLLQEMGYSDKEAIRALRFTSSDITGAVTFLTEQREKQKERKEQRRKQRQWNRDRVQYGKTSSGKYVSQDLLGQLCQLGYDTTLAAEALRQADNDEGAALDVLTDPVKRSTLQLAMVAKQMMENERGPQDVDKDLVTQLMAAGFKEKAVRLALKAARDDPDAAMATLLEQGESVGDMAPLEEAGGEAGASTSSSRPAKKKSRSGSGEPPADSMDIDGKGAAGAEREGRGGAGEAGPSEPPPPKKTESDEEMENELAASIGRTGEDPMAAYDVAVEEEGDAIQLYMALLNSG